jgi:hypothetical protein
MHKKLGTYMCVESDSASGKFEVEITKFTVTSLPLQFTCCTEMSFFSALPVKFNRYFYSQ